MDLAKAKAWYMARIPSHMGTLAFTEIGYELVPYLHNDDGPGEAARVRKNLEAAFCVFEMWCLSGGEQAAGIIRAWRRVRKHYPTPRGVDFRGILALGLVRQHHQPQEFDTMIAALAGQLFNVILSPKLIFDTEEEIESRLASEG